MELEKDAKKSIAARKSSNLGRKWAQCSNCHWKIREKLFLLLWNNLTLFSSFSTAAEQLILWIKQRQSIKLAEGNNPLLLSQLCGMGSAWDSSPLTLLKSSNTGFAPYLYFPLSRSFSRILPLFPWVDSASFEEWLYRTAQSETSIPSKCWWYCLIRDQTQNELEHPSLGTRIEINIFSIILNLASVVTQRANHCLHREYDRSLMDFRQQILIIWGCWQTKLLCSDPVGDVLNWQPRCLTAWPCICSRVSQLAAGSLTGMWQRGRKAKIPRHTERHAWEVTEGKAAPGKGQ